MQDNEAFELIDAHLDHQPLTDEQSDALTEWIRADAHRADDAFYRIFLHSYLRQRIRAGFLLGGTGLAARSGTLTEHQQALLEFPSGNELARWPGKHGWRQTGIVFCGLFLLAAGLGWWSFSSLFGPQRPAGKLYAYEGFAYPPTVMPEGEGTDFKWPTTGGMNGLNGGAGWSSPWQETNSKVAVIVDYGQKAQHWEENDMRKFGPLGYSDPQGNVLQSAGLQLRTATSPRSITTRHFDLQAFPESARDEKGLGRDGTVIWFSFLAQSSLSTAENNRYSYMIIGSKTEAGLRVGKLGAAPSGNWTATGMMTGAEVNIRTSPLPSGEMVLMVTRVVFRPGPEEAAVWINPPLGAEPKLEIADLRLQVPDFRFDGVAIHANHSTDFDEIRFGSSFSAVTPLQ